MCENPQLSIIKYVFNKKNVSNNDESVDSFFDNGISFPQFVSLIFDVPEIPLIKPNPKNVFHKKENNDIALKYILDHNEAIKKFNPTYNSNNDKNRLLSLIFTKQCFLMTIDEIISKSNTIFKSFGISIEKKNQITDFLYINNILHILTDGKVNINIDVPSNNINNLLKDIFEKANVPLVINQDSFKTQNQYILFIQIQIIFDQYKEKINQITNNKDSTHDISLTQLPNITEAKSPIFLDSNSNISINSTPKNLPTKSSILSNPSLKTPLNQSPNITEAKSLIFSDSNSNLTLNKTSEKLTTKLSFFSGSSSNIPLTKSSSIAGTNSSIFSDSSSTISLTQSTNSTENRLPSVKTNTDSIKSSFNNKNTESSINLNTEQKPFMIIRQESAVSVNKKIIPKEENGTKSDQKEDANMTAKNEKFEEKEISKNETNASIKNEDDLLKMTIRRKFKNKYFDNIGMYDFTVNYKHLKEIKVDKDNIPFDEDQILEDISLYQTVCAISKMLGILTNFNNFEQSFQNNFIPEFVMKFLNISQIPNVTNCKSKNKYQITIEEINNFNAVVNFLETRDKAFGLLFFRFYNSMEREQSAKLLFKYIINLFFLKKNQEEMMERCKLLKNGFPEIGYFHPFYILCKFCDYLYQSINNEQFQLEKLDIISHQCKDVPIVFNQGNSKIYFHNKTIPDSFYYQLQFIFNKIDDNTGVNRILEILLKVKTAYKNIKKEQNFIQTFISNIKAKAAITKIANIADSQVNINDSKNEQNQENIIQQIFFEDRYKNKNEKEKENQENNDEDSINYNDPFYQDFWNNITDSDYTFDKGIFFDKNQLIESKKSSTKIIQFIQKFKTNDKIPTKHKSMNFKIELYKLFYYDESKNEWIFNSKAFEKFRIDKKLELDDSQTPLLFYFNSNENYLFEINKNFIQGDIPPLISDTNLFVYCLCDKTISSLLSKMYGPINIEQMFHSQSSFKPIFLMIHIPLTNSKIMANIKTLLIQIYSYLLFICNYTIVLLDDNHFLDQIENFKLSVMFSSFVFPIPQITNEKEENYYDDDDDDKSLIFKNKSVIFLFNRKGCIENEINDKNVSLIDVLDESTKTINKSVSFHIIDVDNFLTYRFFLANLSNQLLKNTSTISEIKNNLELLDISEINKISGKYLYIKNLKNSKEFLSKMVENRYNMFKSKFPQKSNSFILDQLFKEINQFVPQHDIDFINEYNSAINEKKASFKEIAQIKEELQKSSQLNINYLKSFINSKKYLSYAQLNDILKSHIQFLRNEFLSINRSISGSKSFIYNLDFKILDEQMEKDKKVFDGIFRNFKTNIEQQNSSVKYNVQEDAKKGTNYLLKETERLREIKVEVQINKDLKSEIDQDF